MLNPHFCSLSQFEILYMKKNAQTSEANPTVRIDDRRLTSMHRESLALAAVLSEELRRFRENPEWICSDHGLSHFSRLQRSRDRELRAAATALRLAKAGKEG